MWYELSKEWLQAIIPLPRSVAKELFGLSTDVLPNLNGSNLPVTSNLATGSGLPGRWLLPHFQGMLLGKHLSQLQIVQRASGLPPGVPPRGYGGYVAYVDVTLPVVVDMLFWKVLALLNSHR